MEIAKQLEKEELTDFTASNGQLQKWKEMYSVREKRLRGEADEISTKAVQARIERLSELCQGYEPRSVLNIDELRLLFKDIPEKALMEKGKQTKGKQGI